MAKQIPVSQIVQAVGGKENVAQAAHCATRLRVTPRDWAKVDEETLKQIPGVLGVVHGATQVQIIIGAEVNNVYDDHPRRPARHVRAHRDGVLLLQGHGPERPAGGVHRL